MKDLYSFALDGLIPLLNHCNKQAEKPYGIPNELTQQVADNIHKLAEELKSEQYEKAVLEQYTTINAVLNKKYRGELQEMQRQKNKVMAINIQLTKNQCADELEKIRPIRNEPMDNDMNIGYAHCADYTNHEITKLINKLRGLNE